ncbi:hypothetical protein [Nocardia flavorosea]|uniref:Uncharacterized protein n=1 Tax=Nocardia flavorosea TaxID=53429 RepID=A0A846YKU5_9NOCA|nr:hypothetical protein [Nocardia flavorosea]NKY58250.1 hypothetical protein [Nocardia flavorosea]
MTTPTPYPQTGPAVVIATKPNPEARTAFRPWRRTSDIPAVPAPGRSLVTERPAAFADAILTEINRCGVPASYAAAPNIPRSMLGPPAVAQPITVGRRSGAEAIVVVIDRSLVDHLFGRSGDGRPNRWSPLRPAPPRSYENLLCEQVIATATTVDARRLLILCDAEQASRIERTRAIRWVREVAHRIGYECSINGLLDLGTSYLILVADVEAGAAARSVVDWYRTGNVRCTRIDGGDRGSGTAVMDRRATARADEGNHGRR